MSGSPAIAARGLKRRHGSLPVLRGVDLEIPRGERCALFGANGAGKSTFLHVLAGLLRPHAGEVSLLGESLPPDRALRARIGFLGHETSLYGDLSARENLEYYARLYQVSADTVPSLLERVGLTANADRPVRTFSRGMLQRLAVARVLISSPEIVLLDEPFTGLDQQGRSLMGSILEQLAADQVTVLLTTHDFAKGLAGAHRALILHRGQVAGQAAGEMPSVSDMTEIYDRTVAGA